MRSHVGSYHPSANRRALSESEDLSRDEEVSGSDFTENSVDDYDDEEESNRSRNKAKTGLNVNNMLDDLDDRSSKSN